MGASSAPNIRVFILGDSRLFFEGLRRMLSAEPAFAVVGEADVATVRGLVRKASPDVLLADARVDGTLPLCGELRRDDGRPWVILVDADSTTEWAVRALAAGARGVLAKNATPEHLVKAVRVVHEGEIWARKEVVARVVDDLAAVSGLLHTEQALLAREVSCREQEIVHHVVSGLCNSEIADKLKISEATVKTHLTHIFRKLGVRDRAQLMVRYYRSARPELRGRAV